MVIELLKAVLFGIVEGVTEWLPISSTGHLILLDEFITLNVSDAFKSMFDVVIQLGAILAVIVLFFHKLNPFSPSKSGAEKKQTWQLWFKVIAAIIPSGIVGVLFDDWMDAHLHNAVVVSIALIVYGIAFILVERRNTRGEFQRISTKDGVTVARLKQNSVDNVYDITYRTALTIGLFQCLSLIPGTSRSGSTILGAILIGVGRSAGAEFSFFMAIPTMLGASAIKMLKFLLSGVSATGTEIGVLVVGCMVSFVVSLLVIKGLMQYVRSHSFSAFGVYRIVLGIVVLVYFALFA
ncbi:MAG: undecaprenyl-diphosphate phosphatase [Candidatus Faecousia sp.]|nr:undecaprenyl-diphosphate phosphatase [Candidatus Faecousia sp.]